MSGDVTRVYRDEAGLWRWHCTAPNGAIIATSGEAFDNRANAIRAARRANPDTGTVVDYDPIGEDGPEQVTLPAGTTVAPDPTNGGTQ